CQDDDGAARSTHTSLSYPGDRKRQLPLQEQLRPNPNEQEGESRPLDQNLRPKPYMKAGHFSAKIPGQLSAEINKICSGAFSAPARRGTCRVRVSACRSLP